MKNLVKAVSVILALTISLSAFAQEKLEVLVCLSEDSPVQVLVEKAAGVNKATQAAFLILDPQTGELAFGAPLTVGHLNAASDVISVAGEFSDDEGTFGVKISTTAAGVESGVDQNGTAYSIEIFKGVLDINMADGTTQSGPVVCFIQDVVE